MSTRPIKNPVIRDQTIYLGPRLHAFGIGYGTVFYNGLHPRLRQVITLCPAIAELTVPIAQAAAVRRELNFDYTHNMRGVSGKHVTFYREIQKWLKGQSKQHANKTTNIEVTHHA
jgi:hypothetical protein